MTDTATASEAVQTVTLPDLEAAFGRAFENSPILKSLANRPEPEIATAGQVLPADLGASVEWLNRVDGEWRESSLEAAQVEIETAEAGAAILAPLTKPLNNILPGFKVGSAVLGGGIGLITGELIDGVAPPRDASGNINVKNILLRVGVGAGLIQFGGKVMTRDTRNAVLIVLVTQTLADFLPIDEWVAKLRGWLRLGGAGGSGAAAQARAVAATRQQASLSAGRVEQPLFDPTRNELASVLD